MLEYPIPRVGGRADAVYVCHRAVFVMEFKISATGFTTAARAQVWDYALDLKNFHIESHHVPVVPDAPPILDDSFWRNAQLLDPRHEKSTITMRVDDDVLDFFKRSGSGYQSRINAVLRAYVYARRTEA